MDSSDTTHYRESSTKAGYLTVWGETGCASRDNGVFIIISGGCSVGTDDQGIDGTIGDIHTISYIVGSYSRSSKCRHEARVSCLVVVA